MNHNYSFSAFSKQSSKGILVIYGDILIKILKQTWVLFLLFLSKISEISEGQSFYIYLGVLVVFMFSLVRAYLSYINFKFKIENNHFVLKKGIIRKTNTSIAFDRIQNINFKQNLIQQFINVYGVSIETAGSNKTEIVIKALSHSKALALKELISTTDTSSEVPIEKEKPLLNIKIKELLKVSLTENHFRSLLLLLALIIGFFQQIEPILESLGGKEFLDEYLNQSTEAILGSIILLVVLILFLMFVSVCSSFVRIFLRHFNLVLFVKKDAFEIYQGLLTKKSIVLKIQKVQSITVSSNPFKRWVGISYVIFKQALSGKVKNKKDKLIKIIGCEHNQVNLIKNHLFDIRELDSSQKQFTDSYYKLRMLFQSFLILVSINIVIFSIFDILYILFINLLLIPFSFFLVHKKNKKTFYKISNNLILVGKGLIETHHTYFQLFKVQNVKMKQTIFQQRKDVVDLILQTASGKIKIPCISTKNGTDIYNHILFNVENSKQPWM
tara:strand:- start:2471 stop:3964 length:1494 start_codon:yes stop_codon:yes gene_type:complete